MGDLNVRKIEDNYRADFIHHLLKDIEALQCMIDDHLIEKGITRMGVEQEFCLVNTDFSPSTKALEVLAKIDDSHFTTELGRHNLELNLDPIEVKDSCFSQIGNQLTMMMHKAAEAANYYENKIVLTGILPTIRKHELSYKHITPLERYYQLNEIICSLRGSDFSIHLRGVDELTLMHDSILFEACNTSFQMHLQIDPNDMAASYNWAQAIAGPVLSMCTNSPLLLGRELWSETRIALFQQSVDIRKPSCNLTDQRGRVSFGHEWIQNSFTEIFKNDITCHRPLLSRKIKEDSMIALKKGNIPALQALSIFNGTIYRWNRPCYGRVNGKGHIRIENRYLPSGPTITDEVANFAFWVGIMMGRPTKYDRINQEMDFSEAKENFIKAARNGKESQFLWLGQSIAAADLVRSELLPIAYKGLKKANVSEDDIDKYLSIIELRTKHDTGSRWTVKTYRNLKKKLKINDALKALTEEIYNQQQTEKPIHEWEELKKIPANHSTNTSKTVNDIMTTQLFTAHPNDFADFVMHIMNWKAIHHVPVVDSTNKLVGIFTSTNLDKLNTTVSNTLLEVKDVMIQKVTTIGPEMDSQAAAKLMEKNKIGCLPVLIESTLVGIVTKKDFATHI